MTDQQGGEIVAAPATVASTPEAYGERQASQQQPPTSASEVVLDNLSRAAETDVAHARACLKAGYDAAISQIEMQAEMEKARITAQYTDLDGRLRHVEETVASFKVNAVKAMDGFLTQCKTASLTAVELVPIAPQVEEDLDAEEPPRFLREQQPVVPMRRPALIRSIILIAVVLGAALGLGAAYAMADGSPAPVYQGWTTLDSPGPPGLFLRR